MTRGPLAYLDSFAGLVPCRIVETVLDESAQWRFRVRYTATRAPYERDNVEDWPARRIVPRGVISRRGQSLIVRPYSWREIAPHIVTGLGWKESRHD